MGAKVKKQAIVLIHGIGAYPGGHTKYWDLSNDKSILKQIWQILEDEEVTND